MNRFSIVVVIILLTIVVLFASSCTENSRAKNFGGTVDVELLPNEVFVNITFKKNDIWVITQDTLTKRYYAREKSSWGAMEGVIRVKDSKTTARVYTPDSMFKTRMTQVA